MKLLIVICDRNLSKKIFTTLNEKELNYHVSFYGRGTADQSVLALFGLEKTEKEVIISFVENDNVNSVLEKLSSHEFIKNHGAVAFTVPLDGITKNTFDFVKRMEGKHE